MLFVMFVCVVAYACPSHTDIVSKRQNLRSRKQRQYRSVTDTHTDTRRRHAYTALSIASRGKNVRQQSKGSFTPHTLQCDRTFMSARPLAEMGQWVWVTGQLEYRSTNPHASVMIIAYHLHRCCTDSRHTAATHN